MSDLPTAKIDELFRSIPENSGLDPRLIEEAKTELNVLKFRAGAQVQTHKQASSCDLTNLFKTNENFKLKKLEFYRFVSCLH